VGLIAQPVIGLYRFFTTPGSTHKMKRERLALSVAAVVAAIGLVAFVPLPYSVKCTFEVQPRKGQQVFPVVPGQIREVRYQPGQHVAAGDVLLTLENPMLQQELLDLEGRYRQAEAAYQAMLDQRYRDPSVIDQIDVAREVRDAMLRQWEEKLREVEKLTIVAPASGTIIPPPARFDKTSASQGRLPTWQGTPFDPRNRGALLQPSELVCQIGDPKHMDAVLIIDQAYIDLVRVGQRVRLLLEAYTYRAHESQIEEVATTELKVASPGLAAAAGGRLETKTDPAGLVRPLNPSYQARVPLVDVPHTLHVGMQGQARIYTGWKSLGWRLYRYCAKTFHFDL
jgi:putative peptide zinc metalloprotease protein